MWRCGGVCCFRASGGHTASLVELSYSEFERYLEQGWLKDLVVTSMPYVAHYKEPIEGKDYFVTSRVDIDLAEKLALYNVDYKGVVSGGPLVTLIGMLSIDTLKSPFLDPSTTDSSLRFDPEMAQRVSAAVSQLLNDAFQLATDVLALNQSVLKDAARQLLAQETLDDQMLSAVKQKIQVSDAVQQAAFSSYTPTE